VVGDWGYATVTGHRYEKYYTGNIFLSPSWNNKTKKTYSYFEEGQSNQLSDITHSGYIDAHNHGTPRSNYGNTSWFTDLETNSCIAGGTAIGGVWYDSGAWMSYTDNFGGYSTSLLAVW
jgi:hypothetical protein